MLCAERESDGVKVVAEEESKANGPFRCPGCHQEVILRKGQIKAHHFAHKPPVTCAYGFGEKEVHRRCKVNIYNSLKTNSNVRKAELERNLGTVRPDISAYINDVPVAIEVQISSLTVEEVISRTAEFQAKGISLLWVAEWNEKLKSEIYSPRAWERFLHDLYLGRLYYWTEDFLVPYHFHPYYRWVEERSWYNEHGEEESAGGYEKLSKRFVTPEQGRPLPIDIIDRCFYPRDLPARDAQQFELPNSKLYMDNLVPWWV